VGWQRNAGTFYAFIWMLELAHADLTVETSRLKWIEDQCDEAFVEQS